MENQVENQVEVITEEQYQEAKATVQAFEEQNKIAEATPEPLTQDEEAEAQNYITVFVKLKNNETTTVKDFGEDKLTILNEEGKEMPLTRAEFDELLIQGHLEIIE